MPGRVSTMCIVVIALGCGFPVAPVKPHASVAFTLNSTVLSEAGNRSLFSLGSTLTDADLIVVHGIACDLGGPTVAADIARLRGEVVRGALQTHGIGGGRILVAPPIVIMGGNREAHRRADIYRVTSRQAGKDLIRVLGKSSHLTTKPGSTPEGPTRTGNAATLLWTGAALAVAILIGALLFAYRKRAQVRKLKIHQFAPGEREALGLGGAAALGQTAAASEETEQQAAKAERVQEERADIVAGSEGNSMAGKKKTTGKDGPSIKGALEREFAGLSLGRLAQSPVSALQGLTDRHARLLEEAFGIKTVEDLSKLKYVEIARAIVVLSEFDP